MSLEPIPGQPGLFRGDRGEIINIRDFREGDKYSTVYIPVSKRQLMKKSKKWLASEVVRLQAELDQERAAHAKMEESFYGHEGTLRTIRAALRIHFEKGDRLYDRLIAAKLDGAGGEQIVMDTILLVIDRLEAERLHNREQHRTSSVLARVLKPTPDRT